MNNIDPTGNFATIVGAVAAVSIQTIVYSTVIGKVFYASLSAGAKLGISGFMSHATSLSSWALAAMIAVESMVEMFTDAWAVLQMVLEIIVSSLFKIVGIMLDIYDALQTLGAIDDIARSGLTPFDTGTLAFFTIAPVFIAVAIFGVAFMAVARGSMGEVLGFSFMRKKKINGPDVHHIATDKDPRLADQVEKIFTNAGMTLQDKYNKMRLQGHKGPHGTWYNKSVLERLRFAVGGHKPGTKQYREALVRELKSIRRDIRKGGWDALLKARASEIDVSGDF